MANRRFSKEQARKWSRAIRKNVRDGAMSIETAEAFSHLMGFPFTPRGLKSLPGSDEKCGSLAVILRKIRIEEEKTKSLSRRRQP